MPFDTIDAVVNDVTDVDAEHYNQLVEAMLKVMASVPYANYKTATTMSGAATLTDASLPIQSFDPDAARDVNLPASATTNHPFWIVNRDATFALTVKNSGGTTITTVSAGSMALIVPDPTAAPYWYSVSGGGGSSSGSVLEVQVFS